MPVGAVEPQRGCDRIASVHLRDRNACIAASLGLDSSHVSPINDRVFYARDSVRNPYSFFYHCRPRSTIVATVPVHF